MLRSGRSTPLNELSIRVIADSTDCVVGPWSAWSACSTTCSQGVQLRSRGIVAYPVGATAAVCPPTTETRRCNTCDVCSGINCINGGICALATCSCAPGWGGVNCALPARAPRSPYFAVPPTWGQCSNNCGGDGTQTRTLSCMGAPSMAGGPAFPLPASACASLTAPASVQSCNVQPCAEQRLVLSLAVLIGGSVRDIASSTAPPVTQWDDFAVAFATEVAAAVGVSLDRLRVLSFAPHPLSSNISIVTLTVLPPSSSFKTLNYTSSVTVLKPELRGNDLSTAISALQVNQGPLRLSRSPINFSSALHCYTEWSDDEKHTIGTRNVPSHDHLELIFVLARHG